MTKLMVVTILQKQNIIWIMCLATEWDSWTVTRLDASHSADIQRLPIHTYTQYLPTLCFHCLRSKHGHHIQGIFLRHLTVILGHSPELLSQLATRHSQREHKEPIMLSSTLKQRGLSVSTETLSIIPVSYSQTLYHLTCVFCVCSGYISTVYRGT